MPPRVVGAPCLAPYTRVRLVLFSLLLILHPIQRVPVITSSRLLGFFKEFRKKGRKVIVIVRRLVRCRPARRRRRCRRYCRVGVGCVDSSQCSSQVLFFALPPLSTG
jgi:hypothetical protein